MILDTAFQSIKQHLIQMSLLSICIYRSVPVNMRLLFVHKMHLGGTCYCSTKSLQCQVIRQMAIECGSVRGKMDHLRYHIHFCNAPTVNW